MTSLSGFVKIAAAMSVAAGVLSACTLDRITVASGPMTTYNPYLAYDDPFARPCCVVAPPGYVRPGIVYSPVIVPSPGPGMAFFGGGFRHRHHHHR